MYTRPVKHIMCAIALFAAFAAWGRDISIESVNRSAGGGIESVTLCFTAADESSFLYLASDTEDKGTDWHNWSGVEKVAVIPGGTTRHTHEFLSKWSGTARFFLLSGGSTSMPIDRWLDYVEVDGRQTVETPFVATGLARIEMDYEPTALDTACVFSCRNALAGPESTYTLFYISGSGWRFDYSGNGSANTPLSEPGIDCHIVTSNGQATVNGTTVANHTGKNFSSGDLLTLFGLRYGTTKYEAKGRFRGLKAWSQHWVDETLALDLVPASKNGVAGLYNRIDGTFLTDREGVGLTASAGGTDVNVVQDQTGAVTGNFGAERNVCVTSTTRDENNRLTEVSLSITAGAATRWLYVAHGNCAGDAGNPASWSACDEVAEIHEATSTTDLVFSVPAEWNGQIRFFLLEHDVIPCDVRYEYVTVGASKYVETQFIPTRDTKTEMRLAFTDVSASQTPFCARGTATSANTYTMFYIANAGWRFDFGTSQNSSAVKAEADRAYLIETDSSGMSVDGERIIMASVAQFTATGRLALFASHYGNTSYGNNFTGRFYHFRAWDAQSNLALDLLPCSVNGEVCFYDRVSKTYLHPSAAISPDGAAVADNGYAVTASTETMLLTPGGFLVIIK